MAAARLHFLQQIAFYFTAATTIAAAAVRCAAHYYWWQEIKMFCCTTFGTSCLHNMCLCLHSIWLQSSRTPPVDVLANTCTIYLCKYCTSMLVLAQSMLAQLVQSCQGCRRPTLGVLAYACTTYLCLQVLYKYACACKVYACTNCAKLFRSRDAPT